MRYFALARVTLARQNESHSAEASALGFYYQVFFALLTLLGVDSDDAVVGIEQLDDVDLRVDGQTLLFQLKHSLSSAPPPITLKSRALWRTMKVWTDALPGLNLSETRFHLVTVAGIAGGSPLTALTAESSARENLVREMSAEAQRVIDARTAATAKGSKELPFADRVDGCQAFLALSESERLNLLRRTLIKQGSPNIEEIESLICVHLKIVPSTDRPQVAKKLIEWWDRQAVYSLCDRRERVISRTELQQQITEIISELERGSLYPDFETASQPENYQPDGMLARQIRLVDGKPSDLSRAIREEWRAREQRSKWLNEKPNMAVVIGDYDLVLEEHWRDRHCQVVEECSDSHNEKKCVLGLKILRWSHEDAPQTVRPVSQGWNAPYYVRGSYQVLAINLKVGWHPNYVELLGEKE